MDFYLQRVEMSVKQALNHVNGGTKGYEQYL